MSLPSNLTRTAFLPVKLTSSYKVTGFFTAEKTFHANIQLSRFKDVTKDVLGLLNHPPMIRIVWNPRNPQKKKWEIHWVDEVAFHTDLYGTPWPA